MNGFIFDNLYCMEWKPRIIWLSLFIYSIWKTWKVFCSLSFSVCPSFALLLPFFLQHCHCLFRSILYQNEWPYDSDCLFARSSISSRMAENVDTNGLRVALKFVCFLCLIWFLFQFCLFLATRRVIRIKWYQCTGFTKKFH